MRPYQCLITLTQILSYSVLSFFEHHSLIFSLALRCWKVLLSAIWLILFCRVRAKIWNQWIIQWVSLTIVKCEMRKICDGYFAELWCGIGLVLHHHSTEYPSQIFHILHYTPGRVSSPSLLFQKPGCITSPLSSCVTDGKAIGVIVSDDLKSGKQCSEWGRQWGKPTGI